MRPHSASELIAPAIQRTRDLLFHPFAWKTFLKLSFVAVLTEGFSGNFNFSTPGHHNASASMPSPSGIIWTPVLIGLCIAAGIVVLLLCAALFYVIVRLRFALFHCLVYRTSEIRTGWRQYREQAGRFFWLCVVVGVVFLAVVATVAVPFVFGFIHLFQASQGHRLDVPAFLAVFLPLIPVILVIVCAAIATDIVLRDLMLPHMALDDATAGAAWTAARAAIVREKGAFLFYAFLRIALPVAVLMGVMIALAIPMVILAVCVALAFKISLALAIPFGLLAFAAGLAVLLGIGGPVGIALRNYALLFYGGRYAKLGDLIAPEPPPPAPQVSPA
jgi:hypothetical protein